MRVSSKNPRGRGPAAVLLLAALVVSSSCTTLREIPRTDLAARPERKAVTVETRDGLLYRFDYATFDGDSLSGFRERSDLEGPFEHVVRVRIALDDVSRLSMRTIDWYRTGLVGGGVIGAALGLGLGTGAIGSGSGGSGGGGGGGRLPD